MGRYISAGILEERMTSEHMIDLCDGLKDGARDRFLKNVIDRAESIVNGYASKVYVTPLPIPASGMVTEWVMRIAEYELYKRALGGDVPVKYKASYDETIAMLKDVANGLFPIDGAISSRKTAGNSFDFQSNTAYFTEDELRFF